MERINRAREQGWRNVLGSGGSVVKVGSRCRNVVQCVPPTFDCMKWSSLFEGFALGGQLLRLSIINLWII